MNHNAFAATTTCYCWTITRKDGVKLGFTDHDRDLIVAGLTHIASSGLTAADIDAKTGFAVDNSSVSGILTQSAITAQDIDAGLYAGAKIEIWDVDWTDTQSVTAIWSGYFGAIERSGDRFTVELSGQGAQLSRTQGRVFSRMCDARLGDARCGLSIDDFPSHTQCPRTFTACRDIFGNSVNFRGFPYLIGDDAMQSGPDGSPALDGGSRYAAIL